MNAREYARAQQKPLGSLRKLIRAVLHALGVPVTPLQVRETAVRLYRPVMTVREANYDTALTYLSGLHLPPEILAPVPRPYPITALESKIEKVVHDLRIEDKPITQANRADTRVIEAVRDAVEGPILHQAVEPARETVARIGEDELAGGYGWARVLVGAYSCSFCAMLASRGPVYTSRNAAVGRGGSPLYKYHTPYVNRNGKKVGGFCDCIAVIVPRENEEGWEGYAAWQALADLWMDATEGHAQKGARNAFRRDWEKKIRSGETERFLVESLQPRAA